MGQFSGKGKKNNDKNNNKENNDEEEFNKDEIYIPPLTDYKYFNKRMPYTMENMEPSKEEQKLIDSLNKEKIELTEFPDNPEKTTKIIIDTDLGTDWDDAMAVLYALKIPNLEILGITTNYGIPDLRAKVVKKIIDAYLKQNPGKSPIPIIAGAGRPMGTHRELLLYGHEGRPFYDFNELKKTASIKHITSRNQEEAADFIIKTVKNMPNQVKIVSIGIPTNISLAIKKDKSIIKLIKQIIIMGCGSVVNPTNTKSYNPINEIQNGNIINLYPNHNLSGDSKASSILFNSCIPTKVVSHTVTSTFWSEGEVIDFLREKAKNTKDIKNPDTPEEVVGLLMEEWFKVRAHQNGQCPHDPLTVNEAVFGGDKSPVIYARGRIVCHEWAAFSTFIPQKDGPHYLGVKIKEKNSFLEDLAKTIMGK